MIAAKHFGLPGEKFGDNCNLIHVPLCSQETEYTCGVACVQSILGCYGLNYRQDLLAIRLETKPITGTDYHNIISFLNDLGFMASYAENMNADYLRRLIDRGVTPVLMIQAWQQEGTDYATDFVDSHYVIACGYDSGQIFCMDPMTLGNYTYVSDCDLYQRWHVPAPHGGSAKGAALIIESPYLPFEYNYKVMKHLG